MRRQWPHPLNPPSPHFAQKTKQAAAAVMVAKSFNAEAFFKTLLSWLWLSLSLTHSQSFSLYLTGDPLLAVLTYYYCRLLLLHRMARNEKEQSKTQEEVVEGTTEGFPASTGGGVAVGVAVVAVEGAWRGKNCGRRFYFFSFSAHSLHYEHLQSRRQEGFPRQHGRRWRRRQHGRRWRRRQQHGRQDDDGNTDDVEDNDDDGNIRSFKMTALDRWTNWTAGGRMMNSKQL